MQSWGRIYATLISPRCKSDSQSPWWLYQCFEWSHRGIVPGDKADLVTPLEPVLPSSPGPPFHILELKKELLGLLCQQKWRLDGQRCLAPITFQAHPLTSNSDWDFPGQRGTRCYGSDSQGLIFNQRILRSGSVVTPELEMCWGAHL